MLLLEEHGDKPVLEAQFDIQYLSAHWITRERALRQEHCLPHAHSGEKLGIEHRHKTPRRLDQHRMAHAGHGSHAVFQKLSGYGSRGIGGGLRRLAGF